MTASEIDYRVLVDDALRGIVRRVVESVAVDGLPGEHHFFIGFRTHDEGVEMPSDLRAAYPVEMTIVLQHQFWDLTVDEEAFAVTLRFDARESRLRVPWTAVKSFVDPVAEFGLRFEHETEGKGSIEESPVAPERRDRSADVVSLEDFKRQDR